MGREWDDQIRVEKGAIRKQEEGSLVREHGGPGSLVIRCVNNHEGVMALTVVKFESVEHCTRMLYLFQNHHDNSVKLSPPFQRLPKVTNWSKVTELSSTENHDGNTAHPSQSQNFSITLTQEEDTQDGLGWHKARKTRTEKKGKMSRRYTAYYF